MCFVSCGGSFLVTIREPGQRAGLPESVSPKCWPPKNAVSQQLAEEGDEGREGLCKSESPQQDSQSFPEVIRTERVKEREIAEQEAERGAKDGSERG